MAERKPTIKHYRLSRVEAQPVELHRNGYVVTVQIVQTAKGARVRIEERKVDNTKERQ